MGWMEQGNVRSRHWVFCDMAQTYIITLNSDHRLSLSLNHNGQIAIPGNFLIYIL